MKKIIVFIMIGLIIMSACSKNKDIKSEKIANNGGDSLDDSNIEVVLLSPEEGKKILDENEVVLIDVRTTEEYNEGHILGSINIPLDIIESEIENQVTNLDQSIIVYCRSGNRSATAGEILINLGYKKVFDLGGIINWPYEVEK